MGIDLGGTHTGGINGGKDLSQAGLDLQTNRTLDLGRVSHLPPKGPGVKGKVDRTRKVMVPRATTTLESKPSTYVPSQKM